MTRRRKEPLRETISNALLGYAVVVLAIICFLLFLAAITVIVRVVVGMG